MSSRSDRFIGMQLDTCILESMIGVGGMGMVFRARQVRPAREVAVKILSSGLATNSEQHREFLERFRREANVVARLDHINILPIYEYGEQDEIAYLVMPYLTGGSLRDLLRRRKTLSPEEALPYVEQVASALQYAHAQNVVHRDIKPANMLFHADGRLVLVDFGIARIINKTGEMAEHTLTSSGYFVGSVEYMAPEMVQGQPVDARTDIYEFGITLFQILSGRVPFEGETAFSIAFKQTHELPPFLTQLRPEISPEVDSVVQKMIAKNPDDRYNSAPEFAQAYRDAITKSHSAVWKNIVHSPAVRTGQVDEAETRPEQTAIARSTKKEAQPEYDPTIPGIEFQPPASTNHQYSGAHGQTAPVQEPGHRQQEHLTTSSAYRTPYDYAIPNQVSTPQAFGSNQGWQSGQSISTPMRKKSSPAWLFAIVTLCILILLAGFGIFYGPALLRKIDPIAFNPQPTPTSAPKPVPTPTVQATPTATLTPQQAAQTLITKYYADIDNKDYQSAYNLWGSDYQSKNPYQQFMNGFSNTLHDDVTLQSSAVNTDGTIQQNITLSVQQQDSNGNVTVQGYYGYYIVGQENGQWKLITANIQQQ